MSRVRFDILVQNTIRCHRYGGDQPASRTQLGSSAPEQQSPELPRGDDQVVSMMSPTSSLAEQQSSELSRGGDPHALMTKNLSEHRSRAAIKKSLRFLLRPLKPIIGPVARYVRRYFVGHIEALLAHILSLAETLHARQTSLEDSSREISRLIRQVSRLTRQVSRLTKQVSRLIRRV